MVSTAGGGPNAGVVNTRYLHARTRAQAAWLASLKRHATCTAKPQMAHPGLPNSAPATDVPDRKHGHATRRQLAEPLFEVFAAEPATDPRVGRVIGGRYRLLSQLASGAMGVVYRAEQLGLRRVVAVKFLLSPYADKPRYLSAFEREAAAMSRLAHPHCVPAIDYGVEEAPYLVMEFVAGSTLEDLLYTSGPLPWERAVRIQQQLLAGLAHAHDQQIVHRDIKPANIMLAEVTAVGDHVRVLDFGLARLREGAPSVDPSLMSPVAGTPPYMAPEQWRAQPLDSRTDLYAAGVVLFEMLTGELPFASSDLVDVMQSHLNRSPPSLAEANPKQRVPPGLEAVVSRALQKNPADRFPSAQAFLDALSEPLELSRAPVIPVGSRVTNAARPVPLAESRHLVKTSPPARRPKGAYRRAGLWLAPVSCLALVAGLSGGLRACVTPSAVVSSAVGAASIRDVAASDKGLNDASAPWVPSSGNGRRWSGGADPATHAVAPTGSAATPAPASANGKVVLEADANAQSVRLTPTDSHSSSLAERRALIRRLIASEDHDSALQNLQRLNTEHPDDAELAYLIGFVYFQKNWWNDAFRHYSEAMRLDGRYRKRHEIIVHLIRGLGSEPTRSVASTILMRDVGKFALPRLRRAARQDPRDSVRTSAQDLCAHIQCNGRCKPGVYSLRAER